LKLCLLCGELPLGLDLLADDLGERHQLRGEAHGIHPLLGVLARQHL
jgi:hypothetical protein